MDELSRLPFMTPTQSIRSIQPIARYQGQNRRKKEQEKSEEQKSQADALELSTEKEPKMNPENPTDSRSSSPAISTNTLPGEHIDVCI